MSGNLSELFGNDFDFDSIEGGNDGDFLALPAGYYQVAITGSEKKESRNKPGSTYLQLTVQVTSGPHQNRILWPTITLSNRSEIAVKIGRENIKKLVNACGIERLIDTSQFVGKIIEIKVSRKRDEEYGDSEGWTNDVKNYYAVGGSPAASGHSESVADNPAPAQEDGDAPW